MRFIHVFFALMFVLLLAVGVSSDTHVDSEREDNSGLGSIDSDDEDEVDDLDESDDEDETEFDLDIEEDGNEIRERFRARFKDGELEIKSELRFKGTEEALGRLSERLEEGRALQILRILNSLNLSSEHPDLKCIDVDNIRDRVKCRLEIEMEDGEIEIEIEEETERGRSEIRKEFKLEYLPEECRFNENKTERQQCVRRYASVQKCWVLEGDEREMCIKGQLDVPEVKEEIKEKVEECKDFEGEERRECSSEIKSKVRHLIKFRFHNLEKKAERFSEQGRVDSELVVEFISNLEVKKVEFDDAKTKEEKRQAILDVRDLWKEFIPAVAPEEEGGVDEE